MKTKMTYRELREYMQKLEKFPGCERRARAPLVHKGFPGTFNLSFTEYDYEKEFGDLSNFYKDLIFSAIQSCVRPQDIDEAIRQGRDLWKYLGVFEMADIGGQIVLSNQKRINECYAHQLRIMIKTLEDLGLDKTKIYPSYNVGGSMNEITKGKYTFDFQIPEDTLSKEQLLKFGIPAENLITDKTRDTFLSLHINKKTPWGYRNEIHYNIGTKEKPILLDIGTLEHFYWFPTYSGEESARNINGLENIPHTISIGALGLERLCMAVNGLNRVQDVDYLKIFYDRFKATMPNLTEEQIYKAGESIRAMHRIQSDIESNGLGWSDSRKKKRRKIFQVISENAGEINSKQLESLLNIHAESQSWHPELKQGIAPTVDLILNYLEARKRNN
jgi:hypothetical protein